MLVMLAPIPYSGYTYLTAPSAEQVAQATERTAAQECEDLRQDVNDLRKDIAEIKSLLKGNQPAGPAEDPDVWKPAPVIQAKCVSCHNPNKKSGGLDYTDPEQYALKIHEGVTRVTFATADQGRMPPAGGMNDDEITDVGLAAAATLR
jgi:mono/diheme cytochrome c family protein